MLVFRSRFDQRTRSSSDESEEEISKKRRRYESQSSEDEINRDRSNHLEVIRTHLVRGLSDVSDILDDESEGFSNDEETENNNDKTLDRSQDTRVGWF